MTSRREAFRFAAAAFMPQSTPELLKPARLRPGDTIGLITPATHVADPADLLLAERTVQHFGLTPKMGAHVRKRLGYLGGTVEDRLADLHAMFADPGVQGIFCIRGGYGTPQLLDGIDYDLIGRNPKVLLGYSDITALHLAIHKRTGLITFHGPVTLSRFSDYTQKHLRAALFEAKPAGVLANPPETNTLRPAHLARTVRGGRAKGRLIGGNLSLIAATMGTPFEIDTRDKIFFIEDVGEEPYSLDRMLTQLRLAGKLQAAAAVVFGECNSCSPRDYRPAFDSTLSVGEVVDSILGQLNVPVLAGLTIGHTADQLTLPVGVMAELDADRGEIKVMESGVK
jgi:muramoyltetrapeptide carboxypeptidase